MKKQIKSDSNSEIEITSEFLRFIVIESLEETSLTKLSASFIERLITARANP